MQNQKRIVISRTDSIGDVVLTLPLAASLKELFPGCKIIFLGRDYTRAIVRLCSHVDDFKSWDEAKNKNKQDQLSWFKKLNADTIIHVFPNRDIARLAKAAGIPIRIGSSGRLYHYFTCNEIVPLSRKKSDLHESQLNFKLLKPFDKKFTNLSLEQVNEKYGFKIAENNNSNLENLIDRNKFNLVLHPKSKGSAREWPLEYYSELIDLLDTEKIKVFVTGTKDEGHLMKGFLEENKHKITNLTGRFSLEELTSFINICDGLVAASTGPLHIAAALGKLAVGIYPPIRPMHPGRWSPVGKNAHYLVADKDCSDCRKSLSCHCMGDIAPRQVFDLILKNV